MRNCENEKASVSKASGVAWVAAGKIYERGFFCSTTVPSLYLLIVNAVIIL